VRAFLTRRVQFNPVIDDVKYFYQLLSRIEIACPHDLMKTSEIFRIQTDTQVWDRDCKTHRRRNDPNKKISICYKLSWHILKQNLNYCFDLILLVVWSQNCTIFLCQIKGLSISGIVW